MIAKIPGACGPSTITPWQFALFRILFGLHVVLLASGLPDPLSAIVLTCFGVALTGGYARRKVATVFSILVSLVSLVPENLPGTTGWMPLHLSLWGGVILAFAPAGEPMVWRQFSGRDSWAIFRYFNLLSWAGALIYLYFSTEYGTASAEIFWILVLMFPARMRAKFSQKAILFVDGVCVVCEGMAKFVLDEDLKGNIRLGAIQGKTAARELPENLRVGMETIVLKDSKGIHTKSDAALRVAGRAGGLWVLALVFLVIPRKLRDFVYDILAKNRYRWFGKKDVCSLPSASDRDRFVD